MTPLFHPFPGEGTTPVRRTGRLRGEPVIHERAPHKGHKIGRPWDSRLNQQDGCVGKRVTCQITGLGIGKIIHGYGIIKICFVKHVGARNKGNFFAQGYAHGALYAYNCPRFSAGFSRDLEKKLLSGRQGPARQVHAIPGERDLPEIRPRNPERDGECKRTRSQIGRGIATFQGQRKR